MPIALPLRTTLLALAVLLASCASEPPRNPLARWAPSPNHEPRRAILVVLHATEQASVEESLATLQSRNSGGPVSAHYLVGKDGTIYQLVADERRAWHAGGGRWGTITDVNSASIGIELDNDGVAAFPDAQFDALVKLLDDLCTRLSIPRTQVIAHADMAPTRKRDPSAKFPWQRLASAGFGVWPASLDAAPPPGFDARAALRILGYPLDDEAAAIRAFHRRFRGIESPLPQADQAGASSEPAVLDETDARILYAITELSSRTQ